MKLFFAAIIMFSSSAFAGDCFMSSRVRNFQSNSPTELIVDAGRDSYRLQMNYCSELPWANSIAFDSFSSMRVCARDRVMVLDRFSNQVTQYCTILKIDKI